MAARTSPPARFILPLGLLVALTGGLAVVAAAAPGGSPPPSASSEPSTAAGDVNTVAGQSPPGFSGDGGPARQAQMNEPRMVTFDQAGNMYIADTFNQLIRKVDTSGVMSTVAGKFTGFVPRDEADCVPNFSGEGGPATEATLSCPHSVAVDPEGNIYIADSANHVIRKVDSTGTINTIAGQGGQPGDTREGPSAGAKLQGPKGIVLDGKGGLLIADSGNDEIKRLDLAAGTIATIAGTGDPGSGKAASDGDGGPATAGRLLEPRTIALDPSGGVVIAEPKVHRVRLVDASGTITTLAGTGSAGFSGDGGQAKAAKLNWPRGVGVDGAGNVYIADSMNQRIRRVSTDGTIATVAGRGTACYFSERNQCGDGGPAADAGFATPRAIEIDRQGNLLIADTFNERIRMVNGVATPTAPPSSEATQPSEGTAPPDGATEAPPAPG